MEEVIKFISTVGFPIAIATYVVMRLEPTVKENTMVIRELKILVERINGRGGT